VFISVISVHEWYVYLVCLCVRYVICVWLSVYVCVTCSWYIDVFVSICLCVFSVYILEDVCGMYGACDMVYVWPYTQVCLKVKENHKGNSTKKAYMAEGRTRTPQYTQIVQ
jgi:hypothetical protein